MCESIAISNANFNRFFACMKEVAMRKKRILKQDVSSLKFLAAAIYSICWYRLKFVWKFDII
jgi:hypothetical protein